MNDKKFLSQRIRPDSEAAPWVIEEVKKLEARLATLEARLVILESYHQITDRRMSGPKIIVQGDALQRDCGCPANNYVCGNAACPRAMQVICAVSTKEIEN